MYSKLRLALDYLSKEYGDNPTDAQIKRAAEIYSTDIFEFSLFHLSMLTYYGRNRKVGDEK